MAYTRLRFHIVTATKNRTPLLTPDVEELLYEALPEIIRLSGGNLIVANGWEDHTHWLTAIRPTVAVSSFVRDVKTDTSKLVRAAFPDLGFNWQRSFSAFTADPCSMDELIAYIANQKSHHARGTTQQEREGEI